MYDNHFINEILLKIGTQNDILKVPVIIDSKAKEDDCFINVSEKIKRDGGSIIYGWTIHTFSFIYEAERHAVWLSRSNELIDITPRKIPYKEILFVPDSENIWTYNGEYIDNIRVNITKNTVVDDFIILNETLSKLYQTGNRNSDGELMVNSSIGGIIKVFKRWKTDHEIFILSGGNEEKLCYCCNNKTYRECIGLKLKDEMKFILEKIKSK